MLGRLAVMPAQELGGLNFSAAQRRGLKHSLETEGRFGIGFFDSPFLNRSLAFGLRIPIRH